MKDREIGDAVHIRHAPDIDATITAIIQRVGGYVEYELTWISNGEVKVAWLTPLMIEPEKKSTVGFTSPSK